jgi:hypothetical protein
VIQLDQTDLDLELLETLLKVILFTLETNDLIVKFSCLLEQLLLFEARYLERPNSLVEDCSFLGFQLLSGLLAFLAFTLLLITVPRQSPMQQTREKLFF